MKKGVGKAIVLGIIMLVIIHGFFPLINAQPTEQKFLEKQTKSLFYSPPPYINNITYPDNITIPSIVTISANVTDPNAPIDKVKLNINFPSSSLHLTMINIPGTNKYYNTVGLFLEGEYNFTISAKSKRYIRPHNGTIPDWQVDSNATKAYSTHGEPNTTSDVGFLGEVAMVWTWHSYIPGIGDPRFDVPQDIISIEKDYPNGTAMIDEISFGWRVNFEYGPYLLSRISGFYMNYYLDNQSGIPVNNTQYLLTKRTGYYDNYLTFKNIPIPYNGLNNRTIWCKISVVPRLVFMFIPWLIVSADKWIQIVVNFNK